MRRRNDLTDLIGSAAEQADEPILSRPCNPCRVTPFSSPLCQRNVGPIAARIDDEQHEARIRVGDGFAEVGRDALVRTCDCILPLHALRDDPVHC